jgi:hypothetical protein
MKLTRGGHLGNSGTLKFRFSKLLPEHYPKDILLEMSGTQKNRVRVRIFPKYPINCIHMSSTTTPCYAQNYNSAWDESKTHLTYHILVYISINKQIVNLVLYLQPTSAYIMNINTVRVIQVPKLNTRTSQIEFLNFILEIVIGNIGFRYTCW